MHLLWDKLHSDETGLGERVGKVDTRGDFYTRGLIINDDVLG